MDEQARISQVTALVDLRLRAEPTMSAQARHAVDRVLSATGVDPATRYSVLLLVTELVTNAVVHSRTPRRMRVLRVGNRLRVQVHDDTADHHPVVRSPSPGCPHGRGMVLVTAFADDWGVRSGPDGKTVWADVAVPTAAAGRSW